LKSNKEGEKFKYFLNAKKGIKKKPAKKWGKKLKAKRNKRKK